MKISTPIKEKNCIHTYIYINPIYKTILKSIYKLFKIIYIYKN